MKGRCSGCGRAYEISDEFIAMGGRAKCPHCLIELTFSGGLEKKRADRFLETTKPDPNRVPLMQTTKAPPTTTEEVDASCPACGRRYRVDVAFLASGGEARCLHCDSELEVAGEVKRPEPTAVKEETTEVKAEKEVSTGQEPEEEIAESAQVDGNIWGGTREIRLPELEALLAAQRSGSPEAEGEQRPRPQEEISPEEAGLPAEDTDLIPPPQEELGHLAPAPSANGEENIGEEQPEAAAGDEAEEELATELQERPAFPEAQDLPEELEGQEDFGEYRPAQEPSGAAQELESGLESEPISEPESEERSEGEPAAEEPVEAAEREPADLGLGASLAEDAGSSEVSWPSSDFEENQAVGEDTAAAVAEPEPSRQAEELKEAKPGAAAPGSGVFTGLASTDDWAQAAARWAESGFSPDAMPAFIKRAVPDSAPPPEQPDLSHQIGKAIADELAEQPEQPLEISDADIVGDATHPQQAAMFRQEAAAAAEIRPEQPVAAPRPEVRPPEAEKRAKWLRRLTGPVALTMAGAVILISGGVLWWLLAQEDVEGASFPALEPPLRVVNAPPPAAYKTKWEAMEHYGLGNRLAHQGSFEDAVIEFKQAARIDPAFPLPHRALGSVYAVLGNTVLAAASFETYLRLAPEAPDAEQVRSIVDSYKK